MVCWYIAIHIYVFSNMLIKVKANFSPHLLLCEDVVAQCRLLCPNRELPRVAGLYALLDPVSQWPVYEGVSLVPITMYASHSLLPQTMQENYVKLFHGYGNSWNYHVMFSCSLYLWAKINVLWISGSLKHFHIRMTIWKRDILWNLHTYAHIFSWYTLSYVCYILTLQWLCFALLNSRKLIFQMTTCTKNAQEGVENLVMRRGNNQIIYMGASWSLT